MIEEGEGNFPTVLVVIAALNEEQGIGPTIAELRQHLTDTRFLVVDGHSRDKTVEIARTMGADVMYQKGRGKGDAIAAAMENNEARADFTVFIDADYTYPAHCIPAMIEVLRQKPKVGMVTGNRFSKNLDAKSLFNLLYLGNRLLAVAHNIFNGVRLRDPLTGLRVVRAELLRDWMPKSKGFDIEVELNHHVERKGYDIAEVPIVYRPRLGEKKLAPLHGATILKRILSETICP